jgi:hypothetical protein
MDLERFSDFFLVFFAWKCINCGAVIDKTVANNRRKSLTSKEPFELTKVGVVAPARVTAFSQVSKLHN